jgi:O-antigen ligase
MEHATLLAAQWLLVITVAFSLLPSGLSWDHAAGTDVTEGTLFGRMQWVMLFLLAGWILWQCGRRAWTAQLMANPLLWTMLAYCTLTLVWSAAADATFKRLIQYAGLIGIGMAVAASLGQHLQKIVALVQLALMGILLASVLAVIINPDFGVESLDYSEVRGAWRGILEQKNGLGATASLSFYFWVVYAHMRRPPWRWWLAGMSVTLICLVMSRSSTSLANAAMATAAYLLLSKQRMRSPMWLQRIFFALALAVIVGLQAFFVAHSRFPEWNEIVAPFAALFGKSSDLSGRTDIWNYVWLEIDRHLWFGLGYGAYWLGPGSLSQVVIDALFWIPFQAHNGYLDILNELGVVGMLLFVGLVGFHLKNIVVLLRHRREFGAFHAGLLLIYLVSNMAESSALRGIHFMHVMITLSICIASQQSWWAIRGGLQPDAHSESHSAEPQAIGSSQTSEAS